MKYNVGDEVIEKSTGRKGKIISKAEMTEMCYELKFPDSFYNALRFAREITPANTVCTGQVAGGSALPLFDTPEHSPVKATETEPAATCR